MPDENSLRTRFLLLPGWLDSDEAHWQSRWQGLHGCERVEQADWEWPKRGDWMARLDEVLLESAQPTVLIAHSLGVQLVAAWAAHSQHTARVRGALLVAAPDTERDDMPPNLFGWRPIARAPLPFPALLVVSSDDPYCTVDRATEMARGWGAESFDVGPRGHLNSASGLGDWRDGWSLVESLVI